jgi:tetratricopeptide (TPR) repeat protein
MIHALLIPLLLAAPPAKPAPAPAPAADAANVAKAKTLFQAGQKLYKAGKFADAIARFEEAYAARPHPVIFFNIGKCWEQLSENAKALRAYRDYLRLAPDAKDKDTVMDAMANLERRLREKGLQQLLVYAEPASARILVDGKDIGTSPASVELVAGSHKLEASAPGFETYERTFNFSITRASEMTVTLEPPKEATVASDAPKAEPTSTAPKSALDPGPPPPAPPMVSTEPAKKGRLWTYVVGGVAVASAGAGLGLGLAANGEAEKFTSVQHDPMTVNQEYQAARDASTGLATGANVAYGVAGAAAITAVILFILEK